MQELLLAVARGLVEDKEAVKVTVDEPAISIYIFTFSHPSPS